MKNTTSTETRERGRRPSLFGPIMLIALGLFLLLSELNLLTDLHWGDLLRLWPLYLIFLGLNLLVLQVPRPLGTILSGGVALTAAAVAGFILLVGLPGSGGILNLEGWQSREISFAADDVTSAVMDLEIGPPGANLYALQDSNDLIAGTVIYHNELQFDQDREGGRVTVTLNPDDGSVSLWLPEWLTTGDADDEGRSELGLSPDVPLTLSLTAAAGSSEFDLRELALEELSVDVAAGEATVFLPDGDYDVEMETSAGSTTVTLPQAGEQRVEVAVNAGSAVLELPAGREARVEVDQALSGFENEHADLQRVGSDNVWQTAGYEDSSEPITIILHISVGSVTLR
ncbi:MAG: DUF5668 domain-containing protein [Candidatus Promineifilaceae bacterium]|nr:DUF5668 domain-containing protein [Candidatus Promineifilaceae bacterium]